MQKIEDFSDAELVRVKRTRTGYLPTGLNELSCFLRKSYGVPLPNDAYRLTSAIKPNAPPEAYTYDTLDRRSPEAGAPWVYNANGALENGGGATYTYDDS